MNAEAYLRKHGWAGTGTSLHPHKSSSLKKPLLVSKKVDVLGLGLNRNDNLSDQWWLRAFDSSLRALGTGQKGMLHDVQKMGVQRGGLYGRFVRGEGLRGTIAENEGREKTRKNTEGKSKRQKLGGEAGQTEGDKKEARIAKLAQRILVHSRAVAAGGETDDDKALPTVRVNGAGADFTTTETKQARRLARAEIRSQRKERRRRREEK
ncbi:hypothetical protein ANO11243_052920 [Dothideomycetidae sp. 11243]|nr:hypothetical protein ANO11243_052920 [fungal sp. No.11243]